MYRTIQPYGSEMAQTGSTDAPSYGEFNGTSELGKIVRAHRKAKKLTLEEAAGLANLSVRFLSEFERGKSTAEIGKVLKAVRTLGLELTVQPRGSESAANPASGAHDPAEPPKP